MVIDNVLAKCAAVGDELLKKEREIAEADMSVGFLYNHSINQTRNTAKLLKDMKIPARFLSGRKGICQNGEEVAYLQSYNISARNNFVIGEQLVVGNKVRMKPSEITHRAGEIFASIWKKAAPDDVTFDFRGGPEFLTWAIEEPKVRAIIMFGYHLVVLPYADAFKRTRNKMFIFNGPGKNPFIVLEDADVDDAVENLFLARFMGFGQGCGSPGRLYIHAKIYDEFLEKFTARTKKLVVGDPKNPKTNIGPIGSKLAISRITKQFEDAKAKGATIIAGAKIEERYIYPTIISNCNHTMLGMKEESFGPVCWFMPFNSVEEAIALAKDSDLAHSLYVNGYKGLGEVLKELKGVDYIHKVDDYVFGKYGNARINPDLSEVARRDISFHFRPRGSYAYSGWVWETSDGKFTMKQGPKIEAIETSRVP